MDMDIRELDGRALAVVDKLVGTVTPADLHRPTPCAGWTLSDLLQHQISENRGFAVAVREGAATDWHSGSIGHDPYRSYAESVTTVLDAFAEDMLERQVTIREFGTFPGIVAVGMHLIDTVAHGWDIAKSLGLPYEQDEDVVAAALWGAQQIPADPAGRRERGTFDVVVPVVENASALDRFLGVLGRSPGWTPSSLS
jgi:uncharacterized protein (TIGR03086 family)